VSRNFQHVSATERTNVQNLLKGPNLLANTPGGSQLPPGRIPTAQTPLMHFGPSPIRSAGPQNSDGQPDHSAQSNTGTRNVADIGAQSTAPVNVIGAQSTAPSSSTQNPPFVTSPAVLTQSHDSGNANAHTLQPPIFSPPGLDPPGLSRTGYVPRGLDNLVPPSHVTPPRGRQTPPSNLNQPL